VIEPIQLLCTLLQLTAKPQTLSDRENAGQRDQPWRLPCAKMTGTRSGSTRCLFSVLGLVVARRGSASRTAFKGATNPNRDPAARLRRLQPDKFASTRHGSTRRSPTRCPVHNPSEAQAAGDLGRPRKSGLRQLRPRRSHCDQSGKNAPRARRDSSE
jgi:hypothetical protein